MSSADFSRATTPNYDSAPNSSSMPVNGYGYDEDMTGSIVITNIHNHSASDSTIIANNIPRMNFSPASPVCANSSAIVNNGYYVNTNRLNPSISSSANNGIPFHSGDTTLSVTNYTNFMNNLNNNASTFNGPLFGSGDAISSPNGDTNYMDNPNPSSSTNNGTLLSTGDTNCMNTGSLNRNASATSVISADEKKKKKKECNIRYRAKKKSEIEQSAAKIKELEKTIEDLKNENSKLWSILNQFKEFLNFEVAQFGVRINRFKEILNFEIAQLGDHIINRFKEFLNLEVTQLGDRIIGFINFEVTQLGNRYKSR
ncbi:hypothetical protein F8M41_001994 [Gigaspora margarita]|uniref:BZIP domain-containing protein n=1 Tax=Gigaspora margarita TaxID=4874 RepID=A0A8H4A8T6_GIGMA|nr:hypothetical protein F8M41_001994 [Gigaspora margarita]